MTKEQLIATLEKATGPSLWLDVEIKRVCNVPHNPRYMALQYTSSIDAALTLVPPHHLWEVRQGFEAKATVWMLERDYDEGHSVPVGYSVDYPAIALCIASLKART